MIKINTAVILSIISSEKIDYGTVWDEPKLLDVFDIDLPDLSSMKKSTIEANMNRFTLQKLEAYGAINSQLLNTGRCFIQKKGEFVVPSISDTLIEINRYYKKADKQTAMANKLRRSFSAAHPIMAKATSTVAAKAVSRSLSRSKEYVPMTK